MLVRTSFDDSQVMYWEPAKYVAKLRTLKTDQNPLIFYTNMHGGHGGSSGRYDRIHEIAFNWAFLLTQLGRAGTRRGSQTLKHFHFGCVGWSTASAVHGLLVQGPGFSR